MQTVSDESLVQQENQVTPVHHADCYAYKQWVGYITDTAAGSITVLGDATSFVSTGDEIIISSSNLNIDYEVESVSYNETTGETTITCDGLGDLGVNIPNGDYFYLKKDLTEYLINDGIGDIRKEFESKTFGTLRPWQVNLQFIDDGYDYLLTGTRLSPQFFFKDVYTSTVISATDVGNFTQIDLNEHTYELFNTNLLKQYEIRILNGKARNQKAKICKVSAIFKRIWVYGNFGDTIKEGDSISINMQNKFMFKIRFGMKGFPSDRLNIFFGMAYPKTITRANRRVDVIAYSFVKDWEARYAWQVSRETNRFAKIPGIKVYSYDTNLKSYGDERLVKVKYKFPDGSLQGVTGVSIKEASVDVGTKARLLRFKRPNYLQWDGGSWTQKASEADAQTLTASDSSTITVDVRPSDYPPIDTEEIIFFDAQSRMDVKVLDQGPAGIKIDDGEVVPLYSKLFRIWVDESYTAGTIADQVDMTDRANSSPIEVIPDVNANVAIYFGLTERFGAIEIKGLRQLGNAISDSTLEWEYSLSYGTDPSCFQSLTVTDGTNGFSQDGIISWEVPDDWGKKSKIGDSSDFHMYWIRLKIACGGANDLRECDEIVPYMTVLGSKQDTFTLNSDWRNFGKESIDDEVIVRKDDDGNYVLATWKQNVRAIDILDELIEESGYGVNEEIDEALIDLPSPSLNIWGKPFSAELNKPTAVAVGTGNADGYIFVAYKNVIFRLKSSDDEWKEIARCNYDYTIHSIAYFDSIDGAERNFILCIGYKDIQPPGSMSGDDYHVQPAQIMMRIDDVEGDDYFTTFDTCDDGGDIYNHDSYTDGDGLIDNLHLFRSGLSKEITISVTNYYYLACGHVNEAGAVGAANFDSEHICVPYHQLVARLNISTDPVIEAISDGDIDFDEPTLINEQTGQTSAWTPVWLDPGYGPVIWMWRSAEYSQWGDLGVRYSLGQKGGYCGVHFPGIPNPQYGIYGQKPLDVSPITWSNRPRYFLFQTLYYGKGANYGTLTDSTRFLGMGNYPQTAWAPADGSLNNAKFFARTELLDALQIPATDQINDWIIQSTYCDWYNRADLTYKTNHTYEMINQKRIEVTTARKDRNNMLTTTNLDVKHYDHSGGSWANKGNPPVWPISAQLDQNDYLIVADDMSFARLWMEATIAGNVNLECYISDGNGDWEAVTCREDPFSGYPAGAQTGILDFPISGSWFRDDIAGKFNDTFMFKIVQTGTGSLTVTRVAPTRRTIWWNYDDRYYTNDGGVGESRTEDMVPLEMCYDSVNDITYGCMLDQMTMEYYVFALLDVKNTRLTDSNQYSNTFMKHVQISDYDGDQNMQLVGFAIDEDTDYCYFVAADRRFRRKSAQLWRAKYSGGAWTVEKLDDIMAGEWDCPVRLIVTGENRVCGFTGPNYGYFWEWSDQFYIRLPIAKFGNKTIKQEIQDVGQLLNLVSFTDEIGKTIVRKRLTENPTVDIEWDTPHLKSVEFVREAKSQLDGVIVSWEHEDFSGDIKIGETGLGNEMLEINNPHIFFPQTAILVGEELWKFFVKRRREVEGILTFLYQHQMFDTVQLLAEWIENLKNYNIEEADLWQLIHMTVSWKRKNIRFVLLENKTEETPTS